MNKQNRKDYGNAQNTIPTVPGISNIPAGKPCNYPTFTPTAHPFKGKGKGAKTKL